MSGAKLQLSAEEMALVSRPDWILTKNSIMDRAVQLMAALSEEMRPELTVLNQVVEVASAGYVPPPNWNTPKISKGENYLGLPYVVLDYPRLFAKEHVLAIRTKFWWGHYFSVTLHLKGWMQVKFLESIIMHTDELAAAGFYLATSGDEWQHELEGGSYAPLRADSIDPEGEYPFVKLSATCSLDKWNDSPEILLELFRVIVRALEF